VKREEEYNGFRNRVIDGILSVGRVLKANNKILERLNAIFTTSNMFELTNRTYIYLLPQCVEECLPSVMQIVDNLSFAGAQEALQQCWAGNALGLPAESLDALQDRNNAEEVVDFASYAKSTAGKLDLPRFLDVIQRALKVEAEKLVRAAAEINGADSVKLRAFVAGETLAEIVLSQVFLTPRVREAAIQTLGNMMKHSPFPDGDPHAHGVALRRARK
jgi:hypothetical protein